MSDKKRFAKMDKVQLLELLCQLTEENEQLQKRVSGMEEANAELMLRSRELEKRAEEATKAAQTVKADRDALPMGSFAEAMLHVHEIAQRTQAAADEYLAGCQQKVKEAGQQAEEIRAKAEEDASAMKLQAEEAAARMKQEAQAAADEMKRQAETFRTQAEEAAAQVKQEAQAAADEMKRQAEEFRAQAEEAAAQAKQEAQAAAEEMKRQAEEHCRALEEKENVIRARLRTEVESLNMMMARLDEVEA